MSDNTLELASCDYPSSPLSPFLPWCREKLSRLGREELLSRLSQLDIPEEHSNLLYGYITGEPREREEMILPLEADYERQRTFRSTALLFYSLVGSDYKGISIRISGACSHFANHFYNYLEEFTQKDSAAPPTVISGDEMIAWDGISKLPLPPDREGKEEEVFRKAMEFYIFGDNIRACQYFGLLYEKGRKGTLQLDAMDRATLFRCYGSAALNLRQEDLALTVFGSLLNLGIVWNRKSFTARAYRLSGEVYRARAYAAQAAQFYRKSLEQKTSSRKIRFEGLMALLLCEKGDRNLLTPEEREELLNLTVEMGKSKCEGVVLLYSEPERLDEVEQLFKARENRALQAEALHARGMYEWKAKNDADRGEKYLIESLRISRKHKLTSLETKNFSSLGYINLSRNRMRRAFLYFGKSLEGFLKEENFQEIAEVYLILGEMGLLLSQPSRSHVFLQTARFILTRMPRPESRLKDKLLLLSSRVHRSEGAKEGANQPPSARWLAEPLDGELVKIALRQYVRYEHLKQGMYEMNLLSDIQSILAGTEEKDMLILLTMERLLSSSLVSTLSYFERLEDSYRLAYHSSLLDEEPDRAELDRFLDLWKEGADELRAGEDGKLYMPVLLEKKVAGIIICRPESGSAGTEDGDWRVFSILTSQFSSALERIRQKELILSKNRQLKEINRELKITTLTDPLTGIGNRNRMDEKILEFSRKYSGDREKDNFALLFIDLDNFKYYNDTFGHPLGDRLLEDFSLLLREACRESDWIFRYGGDEFVILLAETDSDSAVMIADRILSGLHDRRGYRDLLGQFGFKEDLPSGKWLGCSIGISDYRKSGLEAKNLLEQADTALYRAKEAGKGKWIIFDKEGNNGKL